MTRELRAALAAEGPSDHLFLPKVLTRALVEMCQSVDVDIQDVEPLAVRPGAGLVDAVCVAAMEHLDSLAVVFYHYDGTADPLRRRQHYWQPMVAAWRQLPGDRELVPVVPVRETEAWALADVDALRHGVPWRWSEREVFQADRLPAVESLHDPKRTLREITARGRGARTRRRGSDEYLPLIAEQLSLERLRSVPSFQLWCADTVEALRKMRFLP